MTATGHLGLWRVLITDFVQVFCCSCIRQAATDLVKNRMVETVGHNQMGPQTVCFVLLKISFCTGLLRYLGTPPQLMVAGHHQSYVALNQRSPLVEKHPSLIGCPFP